MKGWFKSIIAIAAAILLMVVFRNVALTVFTINGEGFEPEFIVGDRVLVNRWSYGLRTGFRSSKGQHSNGLFSYGRIGKQPVRRCDIVAYDDPTDSTHCRTLFGRVCALPGDTLYKGIEREESYRLEILGFYKRTIHNRTGYDDPLLA